MMELAEVMEVMKDEVMMEVLQVPDDEDAADGARGHSLSGINPSPSAPADVTARLANRGARRPRPLRD